eukprot:GHVT01078623.1.p1 GENE.GHVT01078623.1~~GHVT01078623.1.p1  ORF type:complete len:228 (-),score=5.77 GHVT01078623.1:233-916(-)
MLQRLACFHCLACLADKGENEAETLLVALPPQSQDYEDVTVCKDLCRRKRTWSLRSTVMSTLKFLQNSSDHIVAVLASCVETSERRRLMEHIAQCFTSVRLNHLSEYLGLQISSHAKAVCEASGWTIVEVGTEMFARPSPKCQQEEKKRFVCAQRDVPRILRLDFKEETWTGDDAEQHLPLVPCSGELVSGLESADMAPGATSNHLQQVYSYLRYLGSLDVGGSSQS